MATILILEDDPDLGPLLSTSLEAAGHSVTLVASAIAGEEAFRQNPADLVVADLIIRQDGRPVADGGLLMIHRIKEIANEMRKTVPVIAISGAIRRQGMTHALSTAQHVGADEVLAKPFPPEDLLWLIDRLLGEGKAG